jgi:hypothetical protein
VLRPNLDFAPAFDREFLNLSRWSFGKRSFHYRHRSFHTRVLVALLFRRACLRQLSRPRNRVYPGFRRRFRRRFRRGFQ